MFFFGKLEMFSGEGKLLVKFLWVIKWNGLWFSIICLYFGVFMGSVSISKFRLLLVSCCVRFVVVFFCSFNWIFGKKVWNVFSMVLNKNGVMVGIILSFSLLCC